jgi:hypothetical protein
MANGFATDGVRAFQVLMAFNMDNVELIPAALTAKHFDGGKGFAILSNYVNLFDVHTLHYTYFFFFVKVSS